MESLGFCSVVVLGTVKKNAEKGSKSAGVKKQTKSPNQTLKSLGMFADFFIQELEPMKEFEDFET